MSEPTEPYDRYRAIGLRGNPFAADEDPTADDEAIEHRFVSRGLPQPPPPGSRTIVQVLGDQGAGKTTHVLRWRRLTPGPYHYVPRRPYRQRWRRPPVGPVVYADEIDRMPKPIRWLWFRALARAEATVVTGTHVELTKQAERAGLQATAHHLGPVDRVTLSAIVDARLRSVAIDPEQPAVVFDDADLAQIHEKSRGSVREAEVLCHELLAERVL